MSQILRRATPRPWSLTRRLAWRLAWVMIAAILLAATSVVWRTMVTLRDLDDSALQEQVRLVAEHLPAATGGDQSVTLPYSVVRPFRGSDGDNLFIVLDKHRQVRATSDDAEAAQAMPFLPDPLEPGFLRVAVFAGHTHGMVGFAQAVPTGWVVVLQGREQTHVLVDSLMTHFLEGAIWFLAPIGVATLAVSFATLRRGLRPVTRASAAAAAVRPSEPGVRLPTEGLPTEVMPLVTAVNDALSRLEQTIATQRLFMAQAAHGLRTPLAVLTARLDAMGDTAEAEALRHDADRMSRLVSQLLRMARLESLPLETRERVDLHAVAAQSIAHLAPLGLGHGIDLALSGDAAVPLKGNSAALELALTNLIENAIGYAPRGSTVEVVVTAPGQVTVMDRGPGVAAGHQARILQPFERGPDPKEGGAGLGLAIVSQIVKAHGGWVEVGNRPDGGAVFTLHLHPSGMA